MVNIHSLYMILLLLTTKIKILIVNLCVMIRIELIDINHIFLDASWFYMYNHSWIKLKNILIHIYDQESWIHNIFALLSTQEKFHMLLKIAEFTICLIERILGIQAKPDIDNNILIEDVSPIISIMLIKIWTCTFITNILDTHHNHIKKHWLEVNIEQIETSHMYLVKTKNSKTTTKASINCHNHKTIFNNAWGNVKGWFMYLCNFCRGLANLFTNITSIE